MNKNSKQAYLIKIQKHLLNNKYFILYELFLPFHSPIPLKKPITWHMACFIHLFFQTRSISFVLLLGSCYLVFGLFFYSYDCLSRNHFSKFFSPLSISGCSLFSYD